MTDDPFELERFVGAQAPVFAAVLAELRAGHKRTHWMWFVFPQLRGLGRSSTAQFYGIASLAEARAYLAHPILGPRLIQCTQSLLDIEGRSLHAIFGSPDDLKFKSSMSLFAFAVGRSKEVNTTETGDAAENVFMTALSRYADGNVDAQTRALLQAERG